MTAPLSPEERDALRRLAEQATPGPWTLCVGHYTAPATKDCGCHGGGYSLGQTHQQDSDVQIYSPPGTYVKRDHRCYDNAAYIAAASPDAILALLDDHARLTVALQAVTEDSARLDWLQANRREAITMSNPDAEGGESHVANAWGLYAACETVREAIDTGRRSLPTEDTKR